MAESLLNSKNPLTLFHSIWIEYALTPFLESHRRIRQENYAKERAIIRQLDAERARAWYAHDLQWGFLNAA